LINILSLSEGGGVPNSVSSVGGSADCDIGTDTYLDAFLAAASLRVARDVLPQLLLLRLWFLLFLFVALMPVAWAFSEPWWCAFAWG